MMAAAAALTAALQPGWPVAAVAAAMIAFSATAVSWHGVLLAEAARLAPEGRIAMATGGVLAFGDAASLIMPLVFGGLLALTGSYRPGFLVGGLPALAVGLYLLAARRRGDAPAGGDALRSGNRH